MSFRFLAAVASLLLAPSAAGAQDVDGFSARSFKAANGVTMPYRLFIPSAEARKKALPLVVYLRLALRPAADDPVAAYALRRIRERVGEPLAVQAARHRRLSCRSHSPIWFQLAKFRLAKLS